MSGKIKYVDPDEIDYWFADSDSAGGNSPAVLGAPGGALIVGKKVDADTRTAAAQATGAHGHGIDNTEHVVFVPQNIIDQIRGGGLA